MRIIVASNNQGKIREIKKMFNTENVFSLNDIGYKEDIEEYGKTFYINALIKVEELSEMYPDDIIISDDSGLCVESLNNDPGVYSARYAKEEEKYKENKDKANNELLLRNMQSIKNRKAYFITIICVKIPGKEPTFFNGKLKGEIANEIHEGNGFGYDPLFIYEGRYLSTLTIDEKNTISHRAKALKKTIKYINNELKFC